MDIPREPPKKRKKYVYGGLAFGGVLVLTVAIGRLEPAAPSVERSAIFVDSVRRGTMVREVRAPGSLVPERIRWVAALTAGRVERKRVEPGTTVDAATVLVELSNPDVQLELLEAERQLSQAQADLANLQTTLESQRLNQAGVVAQTRSEYLDAKRQAEMANDLVGRDASLLPRAELERRRERAEELATRLDIEKERLEIFTTSIDKQLEVARGQVRRLTDIVAFQRGRVASMQVKAGMHGVLQDMDLEEGQWVLPGQTLARVVNPERLKAELQVPQIQARDVALGHQEVFIDTRRDTIIGRVMRIDPAVQNGAVTVDVALEGELPQGARPDLSVDGTVQIERLDDVLYVGRPAFGQANSTVGLFRLMDGGVAERVNVRLGRSSVNTIEIVSGLALGDVVILSDMSQWDSYDRVRLK